MHKNILLKENNINIFNFEYIFKNEIEPLLVDDLHKYCQLTKLDRTAKRLFFHHIFYGISRFILKQSRKEKIIIFYDYNNTSSNTLIKYVDEDNIKYFLNLSINKLKAMLPVRLFCSSFSFDYFYFKYLKKEGIAKETIIKIKHLIDSYNFSKFTFEKIRKFTEREGLTFLNKEFFNNLKSKQLLLF